MLPSIHYADPVPASCVLREIGTAAFSIALIVGVLLSPRVAARPDAAPGELEGGHARFSARVFAIPDCFVENRGQWTEPSVRYLLCREGFQLLATREGPVMHLMHRRARYQSAQEITAPSGEPFSQSPRDTQFHPAHRLPLSMSIHSVSWRFPGGRVTTPKGARPTGAVYHSHVGPPSRHQSDLPVYQEVHYPRVYPGIDLVLRAEADRVVFAWIVSPGADWRAIRMQCPLASAPTIHQRRFLLIPLADELFLDLALRACQPLPGGKHDPGVEFQVYENNEYGFLPGADRISWLPLVFTLEMAWSTVFGPGQGRAVLHTRADSEAGILAMGWKLGPWLPAGGGAGEGFSASRNVFLAAFARDATPLWFSEWGGGGDDYPRAMLSLPGGCVFLAGATDSRDLYSIPAHRHRLPFRGGVWDGFAALFSSDGHPRWAATFGGSEGDIVAHLEMPSSNSLLLMGSTDSLDFPVTGQWDTADLAARRDTFAVLFSTRGEPLRSLLFPAVDTASVRDFLGSVVPPVPSSEPVRTSLFTFDLETGPGLSRPGQNEIFAPR